MVKAPLQARKFEPGQFYRLQNFETSAPVVEGTRMRMESLALTGAWVDEEKGLLSMIVLEMGTSSRLCSLLKEGEEVVISSSTRERRSCWTLEYTLPSMAWPHSLSTTSLTWAQ